MCNRFLGLFLGTSILIGSIAPTKAPSTDELLESKAGLKWRVKTHEELILEYVIDDAFKRYFKTYEIAGRPVTLRVPFGQSGERSKNQEFYQYIFLGGKGVPREIWAEIDSLVESVEFNDYISYLKQAENRVIIFNIKDKCYFVSHDSKLIEQLLNGPYPGSSARVFVLKTDSVISAVDIYNYLYCVGAVGIDCSGFVYYVQKSIAVAYGVNLDEVLADIFHTSPGNVPQIIGLWFYSPGRYNVEIVEDKIENLRPGDIFLFRGRGNIFRHSAVIQSIDFKKGEIRYIQCTDWAPQIERGVHESFINFNPSNPGISLKDKSVEWTQRILPTFTGEAGLKYWKNDGDRYRAYSQSGGSVIVRLKLIKDLIEKVDPSFYRTLYGVSGTFDTRRL